MTYPQVLTAILLGGLVFMFSLPPILWLFNQWANWWLP
jgi:hypothetical protein